MRTDRLLKLADYLVTVPRERFDMGTFYDRTVYTKRGFAGCALGWAAVSGKFKGLKWDRKNNAITYEGEEYFSAAMKLFDIDYCDASDLFGWRNWEKTPKQEAKHIRQFVKANSSSPSGARSA